MNNMVIRKVNASVRFYCKWRGWRWMGSTCWRKGFPLPPISCPELGNMFLVDGIRRGRYFCNNNYLVYPKVNASAKVVMEEVWDEVVRKIEFLFWLARVRQLLR